MSSVDFRGPCATEQYSHEERYSLREHLGMGGMGVVYRAIGPDGTEVALKRLRAEYADREAFRRDLAREVTLLRRLQSPYVPALVDADVDGPLPWLATRFIEGPSLFEAVSQNGQLPRAGALDFAVHLTTALDAVHSAGVLHRDVKPANVLLGPDGPVLIDFGIAASSAAESCTTMHLTGSPAWMAPEQVTGEAASGTPADVFAAALTIAYALTGRSPFGEGPQHAFLYRVVHTEPDLTGVPDDLRDLLRMALTKDPALRPSAAGLRALLMVMAGRPASDAALAA